MHIHSCEFYPVPNAGYQPLKGTGVAYLMEKPKTMKAVILAMGHGIQISKENHLRPNPMIEFGNRPEKLTVEVVAIELMAVISNLLSFAKLPESA